MMTIMGKQFSRRGVSVIIAALLLIAIAVAAAVLLYVFSIGLLGSLSSSGGQQTKQQLILEAYNWGSASNLVLNLRNTGSASVNVDGADVFVNGTKVTNPGGCSGSLAPQGSCILTIDASAIPSAPVSGVAYVIKMVTPDGAVFSYSATYGQAA